jgi:hypothetical protein
MTIRGWFSALLILGFAFQGGAHGVSEMTTSDDWGKHVVRGATPSELEKLARSFHQDWAWEFPNRAWEMSDLLESANRYLCGLSSFERGRLKSEMASFLEGRHGATSAELAEEWYELGAYFPPADQAKETLEAIYELLRNCRP